MYLYSRHRQLNFRLESVSRHDHDIHRLAQPPPQTRARCRYPPSEYQHPWAGYSLSMGWSRRPFFVGVCTKATCPQLQWTTCP